MPFSAVSTAESIISMLSLRVLVNFTYLEVIAELIDL
jgi:hypothetical protein